MYHFVDLYSLLSISPEASPDEVLTAIQKNDFFTTKNQNFSEAKRILTDPVLRASYDQEYYRIIGTQLPPDHFSKPEKNDSAEWLKENIATAKAEFNNQVQPVYYYKVTESLLTNCHQTPVSERVYNKSNKSITNLRNEAHKYFEERKKLIEFWVASNIYKKEEDQTVELCITLVEHTAAGDKNYVVKSLNKITPQNVLVYEAGVMKHEREKLQDNRELSAVNQNRFIPASELQRARNKVSSFYELLGIPANSTQHEIELAYKRKQNINSTSMWHPDWNEGKPTYGQMRLFHEAYATLSNVNLRKEYDCILMEQQSQNQNNNAASVTPVNNFHTTVHTKDSTIPSGSADINSSTTAPSNPRKKNKWFHALLKFLRFTKRK